MRACWNRQTGTFEGRVSTDVWVQVPLLAPFILPDSVMVSTSDSDSLCLGSNPSQAASRNGMVSAIFQCGGIAQLGERLLRM